MDLSTSRTNNVFSSHCLLLLLIYERKKRITLVVDLQRKDSRFCTRCDKVGVNKDVKETVIRRDKIGVTKMSRKRDYYLSIIYQVQSRFITIMFQFYLLTSIFVTYCTQDAREHF